MTSEKETKKQPLVKVAMNGVSISVWDNDDKGRSVSLQKSFKDKEGKWENQKVSLFPQDFAILNTLMAQYRHKILDKLVFIGESKQE